MRNEGFARNELALVAESKLVTIQVVNIFFRLEGTPQVRMVHPSDFSLKVFAAATFITHNDDYSFTEFNL